MKNTLTKEERANIISLLDSDNDDDFKLVNSMDLVLNLSYEERESIGLEAEKDSKYYIIALREGGFIRTFGFWNKTDALWKDKKK